MASFAAAIGLRFPDGPTEEKFRGDFSRSVLPIQRAGLTLGLIVMALFTIRDVQLILAVGSEPLMFRLFVLIPYLAFGLGLTY